MRESQARSTDQQNSEKDFKVNRTHRLKKYREARKQKGTSTSQNTTEDFKAVNREERMEIKKLRNREAAQRARDKAKLHVEQLSAELEILKDQIVVLKTRQFICIKCSQSCSLTQPIEQTKSMGMKQEPFFQEENIEELQPFFEVERIKSSKSFSFPMFLMVLTVIVCIAVGVKDTSTYSRRPHRLLQQIVNVEDGFEKMKTNVYPSHKEHHIHDSLAIQAGQQENIKELNKSRTTIGTKEQHKEHKPSSHPHINISSNSEARTPIQKSKIQTDNKYDVLYCDSCRIHRINNNENASNTFLQGQFKLILDAKTQEASIKANQTSDNWHDNQFLVQIVSVKINNEHRPCNICPQY